MEDELSPMYKSCMCFQRNKVWEPAGVLINLV